MKQIVALNLRVRFFIVIVKYLIFGFLSIGFYSQSAFAQNDAGGISFVYRNLNNNQYLFNSVALQFQQMEAWQRTFNTSFKEQIAASNSKFLREALASLQSKPNLEQLEKFRNSIREQMGAQFDPAKLAEVDSLIGQIKTFENIRNIGFGGKETLNSVDTAANDLAKKKEFYKEMQGKYPKIKEAQVEFQTSYSSPFGQKLYSLQREVLTSLSSASSAAASQAGLKHSHQLWLADHYAHRGDILKSQFITNEVFNEHYSSSKVPFRSSYLKDAYVDYTRNHLLYNAGFKDFTASIVKDNEVNIARGDFSFLDKMEDETYRKALQSGFPYSLSEEIVGEFRSAFRENLREVAFQQYLDRSLNDWGFSAFDKIQFNKLVKGKIYQVTSSNIDLGYKASQLKSTQDALRDKLNLGTFQSAKKNLVERSLDVSSELRAFGEKALEDGELATSAIYLEASRESTLLTAAQITDRIGTGFVPIFETHADLIGAVSGYDIISGRELSKAEQVLALVESSIGGQGLAFAESLYSSREPVSVQVKKFLESQKLKGYSSLNTNVVRESSPFGEFGKSTDSVTKAGYQELSEILRSDEIQKLNISNSNRLDRLTQKDLERAQQGIFFTPKDSEQGKAFSSSLDLTAKSVALFKESSTYLSGGEAKSFTKDYQDLSRSLAEGHILADKLWLSDQNRAVMLLGQIKSIVDFTYSFAVGAVLDLKENAYGVKDLVVLSGRFMRTVGSSVADSLRKIPELTLHDAEVALSNFFTRENFSEMASSLGTSTISLYHHFSNSIKLLAEQNADIIINGTAKEKGEVVGKLTTEFILLFAPGKLIKGGVGAAKTLGGTASLIGGAAQKSLEYLAFERKAAQIAKLSGIAGAQSLKMLNFARQYPAVAANILKETSSLGVVSELAGMSAKDAKFLGKLALNVEIANKLLREEKLVSKAAIVSRESDLVLKAIPKQSEKLHSLVATHFENSIQKLYKIDLRTYYKELGWHEALIQSNMRTAIDFYSSHPGFVNNGVVNFEKISEHLIGIDFSKPVEIVSLEKGTRLVTWHADIDAVYEASKDLIDKVREFIIDNGNRHFSKGNYFTVKGYSPNQLGIADNVPIEINIPGVGAREYAKVPFVYELSEDTLVLKSRSNMILDSFTFEKMSPELKEMAKVPHPFDSSKEAFDKLLPGIDFATGGGEQYFLNGRLMVPVK